MNRVIITKIFFFSLILFASVGTFVGCKKKDDEKKVVISIKGSDTMVNLAQKWAEIYMKTNPNVSIQVTGGGSGTGVAALLNQTTNIALSSREMKPAEIEKFNERGITYTAFPVALDGLAVIVHPSNPLDSLTHEQIRDIFIGRATNFNKFSTYDSKISIYGRENSSGTYEFFKDHVLGKDAQGNSYDYSPKTQVLQGTSALAEAIARDVNGIAYGGVGYFAHRNDVKIIHIKKDKDSPAIAPAENNKVNFDVIWSGDYSISRNLYMFVAGQAEGEIKTFIEWIVSPAGQKIVETMEYIPLRKVE